MKNVLVKLLLTTMFTGIFVSALDLVTIKTVQAIANIQEEEKAPEIKKVSDPYKVTATMYYAVQSQCDADPLVTAGMYHINPEKASEHKWIAMSRDMLERWGGDFQYGDYVLIEGTQGKDGVYRVTDTMNKRYKNRIDILETKGTPMYKFEDVTITKVEVEAGQMLASL